MVGAGWLRRAVAVLGAGGLLVACGPPPARPESPGIGPERPASDPVNVPAAGFQVSPAVAFDGQNYLVVWMDGRNPTNHSWDIWGTRVTPSGTILDPVGIPIGTTPVEHTDPAVAFGGGTFLVVWGGQANAVSDIHGARVGPDGSVLDPS